VDKLLKIKLIRSPIGSKGNIKGTLRCLKLTKLNKEVIVKENPSIKGMIECVQHLLKIEEIKEKKQEGQNAE